MSSSDSVKDARESCSESPHPPIQCLPRARARRVVGASSLGRYRASFGAQEPCSGVNGLEGGLDRIGCEQVTEDPNQSTICGLLCSNLPCYYRQVRRLLCCFLLILPVSVSPGRGTCQIWWVFHLATVFLTRGLPKLLLQCQPLSPCAQQCERTW